MLLKDFIETKMDYQERRRVECYSYPLSGWAVRVGKWQSLILKTSILKSKELDEGKLFVVPGFPVAGSSGTTRILS
ncbi:hypothetical protein Goshw_007792 [Gossypium schwendimanii]|uniref:Uncharacterized protein n=1 Tax=Gossypium schwendimanii TaxID=34291 RepID=A0A7J9L8G0_GOSSC|nr:hypothetical protein [Gossypium schwendimanii]